MNIKVEYHIVEYHKSGIFRIWNGPLRAIKQNKYRDYCFSEDLNKLKKKRN